MTWNIDIGPARAVCTEVDEIVKDLNPNAEKITTAFEAVASYAGRQTAAAAPEVGFDPFLVGLHAIREHVTSVTTATQNAISAYADGDLEMAAEFEDEAAGTQ